MKFEGNIERGGIWANIGVRNLVINILTVIFRITTWYDIDFRIYFFSIWGEMDMANIT